MLPHGGNLFRSFFFVVVIAISMLMMTVETRYLRPSDHGIDYQNNPTEVESPEMTTFFGGASAELPEAKNSTETETEPRWESIKAPATFTRRDDNGGKDGVRKTLLIASLGCGAIGVSLMVSAVFIYLFQRRRSSTSPSPPPPPPPPQPASTNPCKEIVVHESS